MATSNWAARKASAGTPPRVAHRICACLWLIIEYMACRVTRRVPRRSVSAGPSANGFGILTVFRFFTVINGKQALYNTLQRARADLALAQKTAVHADGNDRGGSPHQ